MRPLLGCVRILPSDTHISGSGGSKMCWLTSISSCKYLNGHHSRSLGPFHASHIIIIIYHSETSMSSPSIISQSHFKTWSRGRIIYYRYHQLFHFQYLVIVVLYVFRSLNINQLLPRVPSLHALYSHPGLNLWILKLRHLALQVGAAHKLKPKPHIQIQSE